jgi:hypothetical protein
VQLYRYFFWVSLVCFATITLCVASQRVFIVVSVCFVLLWIVSLTSSPSYITIAKELRLEVKDTPLSRQPAPSPSLSVYFISTMNRNAHWCNIILLTPLHLSWYGVSNTNRGTENVRDITQKD